MRNLNKFRLLKEGRWTAPSPPVVTARWDNQNWVDYIDAHGKWLPYKAHYFLAFGIWCVEFDDPSVMAVFDTDTLPTAYRADMTADQVLERLKSGYAGTDYEFIYREG